MIYLSNEQKKLVLQSQRYTLDTLSGHFQGRLIGFGSDHRGFGAIVVFPSGHRSFWTVNPYTLRPENAGIPPRPRKHPARAFAFPSFPRLLR